MAFNIKDEITDAMARKLAAQRGLSITNAVRIALEKELASSPRDEDPDILLAELMAIARHCANSPRFDDRTPEEIIGYDKDGLPS